ncbi:nuclear pore complex subunit [Claviceps digitariae]|nr:nuclear pore complex subunit [Claviceps digitariae]
MAVFGQTSAIRGVATLGQPVQNQQQAPQTGGGLFGNAQQQDKPAAGGLFGGGGQQTTSGTSASSVFGQPAQQSPTPGRGMFGSFGQAKPASQGLFGGAQQQEQPTTTTTTGTTGTFGSGGLFGQVSQNRPTTGTTGLSMFGSQPQAQQTNTLSGTTAVPSLFGGSTMTSAAPNNNAQQPQQNSGLLGGSLWGASIQPVQPQNAQTQQPAGAYFDSLFAKTQKDGGNKTNAEDLPSLELGLGDLRHRLRKLQAKQNERPLDGKAHYLLAASGVDPSAAAKDLGMLDVQGGRIERSHGYAGPSEIDVETYLSNLQTKTTLDMISDGLERSLRDFDNFLEDNVAMEWEAQRKRIYQHFGIKPREDSAATARESQGGFGRSRRKPHASAAGGAARTGRNSVLGNSMLQRSVIGTSSRIGTHHQSDFADVDRSADADSVRSNGATEDRVLRERQYKLADKVRILNDSRVMKQPYPILAELAEVEQKSHEPHAPHVVEAYRAMIEIVGEDAEAETTINGATAKERQYAGMYLDENPNSSASIEMKKRILQGSTAFLEKQFLREVESLIAKHPHEAKLGGLPDITSKIKAYIRLRSARKDLVPDNTELQQIQGEFVWAVVFYLLRSGHVNEAAQYVNDNTNHFRGIDRTFATYLNNYAASPDRRITNRKLLDRCTNEYIQRSRNAPENSIDPFRMASYKVIGRIELSNRNLDGLNTDINDWIWLQFNLAREGDKTLEMAGESYGLAELQSSIHEIGTKHFPKTTSEDTTNGSFGMFFYLQILAGMFEDAIAYLYPFSYIDAVHFALALAYYGLLRPSDPMSASNDLRSYSVKNLPQINFGRMLGYYTRDFRAADVFSAVDYLALICLNQDLGGEAGRRQSNLCHEALRELVLETREFSKLIGDILPDGRAIRGIIEERGPLIGLTEETDFVNTVTLQAASFADESGRTTDSVLLYHLAGEYDTVVAIVSRALSEAISLEIGEDPMRLMPVKARTANPDDQQQQQQQQEDGGAAGATSLSLASIDDPVELARTMMGMYERDAMFYRKIQDQNKVACRVLLEMSEIKKLVEGGQWALGLDKIKTLEILPLNAAGDASTIRAYATKFTGLSQPVSINVPNLLLWTIVCCVRQREQLTTGQFSGNEGTRRMMVEQLKQMALDLTTYTSQLRYRFPPHLHEALARASAE